VDPWQNAQIVGAGDATVQRHFKLLRATWISGTLVKRVQATILHNARVKRLIAQDGCNRHSSPFCAM
jgi:hypothetical protein